MDAEDEEIDEDNNDHDDEDEDETDDQRAEREMGRLIDDFYQARRVAIARGCVCRVCEANCACEGCYRATEEHDETPTCDCAACTWIDNNQTLGENH